MYAMPCPKCGAIGQYWYEVYPDGDELACYRCGKRIYVSGIMPSRESMERQRTRPQLPINRFNAKR